MTRGGRDKDHTEAERKCIASGKVLPRSEMIRFVVDPEGTVVPDILCKLPGRGMWVSSRRDAIEKACGKGLFARAAKTAVKCPTDMPARVEDAMVKRVINLLSLARKSGRAVAGFEKVKSWLMSEQARVLMQASDGSGRGKGKLRSPEGKGAFIEVLTANEMGLAFGRENVIHCALAAGGLTKLVVEDAARLKNLRDTNGGKSAGKDTKTR